MILLLWSSQGAEFDRRSKIIATRSNPGTPMVTDPARARQLPELAVLSAYSHGDTEPRTLWAVVEALDATSAEHRTFYYDYVLAGLDRKSTRLNSSHVSISYAVFCLKKKTQTEKRKEYLCQIQHTTRRKAASQNTTL